MTVWWEELVHDGARLRLEVSEMLHEIKSEHQHLELFENPSFGRVLSLDGIVQTTEADEFFYHEMLAHVPILAHGAALNVLIVGGGDGGMLEEVLKHRSVESAVLVDIDRTVIDISRQYLRSICGEAFEDPRTEVVIADGAAYVATTERRFEVIIVDSPDPVGPAEVLFGKDFYTACKRALVPGGVLVTQNGVPFLQADELGASLAHLGRLFADARAYLTHVPTYFGGAMALGWASDDADLWQVPLDVLEARFAEATIETRYYTPAVQRGAFALPRYIEAMLPAA
jgi:spermidine synthase